MTQKLTQDRGSEVVLTSMIDSASNYLVSRNLIVTTSIKS